MGPFLGKDYKIAASQPILVAWDGFIVYINKLWPIRTPTLFLNK